jgi:hypothetical protein
MVTHFADLERGAHGLVTTLERTLMTGVLLPVAACVQEPIDWDAPRDMPGTIGAATRLVMDADGSPRLVDEPVPVIPLPAGACGASLATTGAREGERYAAWFMARPDGSVVLVVARSSDGGATWGAHVVADERDRGRRGCSRPPPALHADPASSYVHAAYFIEPREGAGVWYTHSMERGAIWHQTIGVLYGEEAASAAIASAGDTVLVAYEHPGSGGTRLGLAISREVGHTFDERLRVVRSNYAVFAPRIALRNGRVALAWLAQGPPVDTGLPQYTRLRMGRFR